MTDKDRQYYGAYADALEKTKDTLMKELTAILDSISTDPETRPAEHVLCRIKGSESLVTKMKKKGESTEVAHALSVLSDIVGARIVVHFVGDVYKILAKIKASEAWTVSEVKDYVTQPKKNGYRSLHVILAMPFTGDGVSTIRVEVQLRTIAMDCWASLEHQLRYKKTIANPELIEAELARCAAEMASTDLTMETIREAIAEM